MRLFEDELEAKPAGESALLAEPGSGIGLAGQDRQPSIGVLPTGGGIGIAPIPASGGQAGGGPREEMSVWQAIKESFKPVANARAARRQERELKIREMDAALEALKKGLDLSFGLDGEQRDAFVKSYKAKLDKFEDGLGAAFENLAANPETASAISEWAQESETLKRAIQFGGIKAAKKLLSSTEALKTIQGEIDARRMPILLRKGQTFIAGWQQLVPPEMAESINKDGRVSASELIQANEWLKANKPDIAKTLAFTDRELEVVARNSDAFYHSLGIVSPKDEGQIAVHKAKEGDKAKPIPSRTVKKTVGGKVVAQLEEWDGAKWVAKGEPTPHFKPEDDERRIVDIELKLSDDYRQDTKKFAERRPLFDSSTDYMANRNKDQKNKTSAGDAALMFAYAKMRDPNDRLAVSETRDLVKLGNIFERIGASVVGVLEKGETLPDRVAQQMYDEIRRSFTEQNRQQAKVEADYRKKTTDYKGNPDRVVRSYALREEELNPKDGSDKPSQADIEFTAKRHGITVEEVKRRLKVGKK